MKEQTKAAQPIYDEVEDNDIDSILKQELKELGLEYRFIDFKQAKLNGGRSRNGWIVLQVLRSKDHVSRNRISYQQSIMSTLPTRSNKRLVD
jgi:hypothetical protein